MNRKELRLKLAFDYLANDYARLNGEDINSVIACYLSFAEKKILEKPILTDNQKFQIKEFIERLQKVTGHKYEAIAFVQDVDRKYINLYWHKNTSEEMYHSDEIETIFSFQGEVFEYGKQYNIKELLGER